MALACFAVFRNLFPSPSTRVDDSHLSLLTTSGMAPMARAGCVFCDVTAEKGFRVVDTNDEMIAFHDRSPGAQYHILVIPREHIPTVKDLREPHIPLLTRMEQFGHHLLDDLNVDPNQRRLGFHIPPFSSVHHLHLHVLSLPLKNLRARIKYRPTSFILDNPGRTMEQGGLGRSGKRWGWFVAVKDVKDILTAGKTVKVGKIDA